MQPGAFTRACLTGVLLCLAGAAHATFHLWTISEIYSNADGTVQFMELATAAGGQQFIAGHTITSSQGAATHSFTFASDLPGDTTNKTFLIGTQGFAALNVVTPDYVVPDNFLFLPGGAVNFAGVDSVGYASLPSDGTSSIDRNGTAGTASPRNFGGATGTLAPPSAPGAPTIVSAVAGDARATISFAPPADTGGSPILGYTVTCNPGGVPASGTASPITVTGLTNGIAYACAVVATNAVGAGPPSSAIAVSPAVIVTSVSGASATGTGTIAASFTGGGASCSFTSARFIPVEGDAASPPFASAPGLLFPHGLFTFTTAGCAAGSTITMVVTYAAALPATARYWKYGPTAALPTPHWYVLPAIIAGNQATLSIADGGLGDDDLAANGTIVDQGGPAVAVAVPVPTLARWALLLTGMLLLGVGMRRAGITARRG